MKNKLNEKIKYNFDNLMSKGTGAMLAILGVFFLAVLLAVSIMIFIIPYSTEGAPVDNTSELKSNFFQILWMSFLRTLDPGTMGGDSKVFGIFSIFVTCAGIFILSALIGILNNGIQDKLEMLRKGRSKVIENNHTIILGWSEQIFTIISELTIANQNKRKSCIAIMGEKDKVEMEEEISAKVGKTGKTKIVCRQGSPIELSDLEIVNINTSKSIIILSQDNNQNADSNVIKTILAIVNYPGRRKEPYNIIAEIRDPKNVEIAKIIGKDEVEIILVGDLISRITAQTCRQPGLSLVYTELLDFGGVEIYFKKEESLIGKKFSDCLFKYDDSTVIGIFEDQKIAKLNPPMDKIIGKNDSLIIIAEDDDTIKLSGITNYNIDEKLIQKTKIANKISEKTLILGWNWKVTRIIKELDSYVSKGSKLTVAADFSHGDTLIKKECSGIIKNLQIKYIQEDTTDRKFLDKITSENYDHIIVVCYDNLDYEEADAKTLITLLHLRDIAIKTKKNFSIVSEMLDIKNRNLAEVSKANDFIVSDKIISLLLSQISENKYLNAVFTDLFDPEGSEIYIKPAINYVKPDVDVNFYTIVESARKKGEIAIGYKIESLVKDNEQSYGVFVNPIKSKMIKFSKFDKIIVLSED
jgi:Trk K+ transport system NAD-binding subunit